MFINHFVMMLGCLVFQIIVIILIFYIVRNLFFFDEQARSMIFLFIIRELGFFIRVAFRVMCCLNQIYIELLFCLKIILIRYSF